MSDDASMLMVFDDLCARHGGEALSVADKAIIRKLALLLTSDDPNAGAIAALTALLPAPGAAGAPADGWNLSALEEHEFGTLIALAAKCQPAPIMNDAGELVLPARPETHEGRLADALAKAGDELRELRGVSTRLFDAETAMHAAVTRAAKAEERLAQA